MSRILIIGCSGTGKSTLARRLGKLCDLPYIDTDAMYWRAEWTPVPAAEVVKALPLNSDRWVIDGNFADCRDDVWRQADCIIWLDYPLWRVLCRVTARNLKWWVTRKQIWSENQMTLARVISGIRFAWRRHPHIRRTYPAFLNEFEGKAIHVFSSPRECDAWVAAQAVP